MAGRNPCIIGVARRTWHPADLGDSTCPEPLEMWAELATLAANDAGAAGALSALDRIEVVYCQSWQYDDPAARLAQRLGAKPSVANYSGIGGSVPQSLVAAVAADIVGGTTELALVTGSEALASLRRLKKVGEKPQWSFRPDEKRPFPFDIPFHPAEIAHSIFEAYLTFALFDSARRAQRGLSLDAHRQADARLLSPMTAVAAASPHAWFPVARSPEEIAGPSADNRFVAYPYSKLMTSIMDVDMGAALLVASDDKADELGIEASRRVYLRGNGYALDPFYVAERADLWRSGAMRAASTSALAAAGITIDEVSHIDLYSCFASSLGFALDALGLDPESSSGDATDPVTRPITVTGGLPYHGGPGSAYMVHSIAAICEQLRTDPGSYGLVSGVGMHMTKHVYGVYSTTPGDYVPDTAPTTQAQAEALTERRSIVDTFTGTATVAAYSVLHDREGMPTSGALVLEAADGVRTYGRLEDVDSLARSEKEELIGSTVAVTTNGSGVNLISV